MTNDLSSPSAPSRSDRRRHRRVACNALVRLHVGDASHAAHCLDLSLGGVRLRGAPPLGAGTQLDIEVDLEQDHPVRAIGEVVRHGDAELAVRFVTLDPGSLRALHSSIQ